MLAGNWYMCIKDGVFGGYPDGDTHFHKGEAYYCDNKGMVDHHNNNFHEDFKEDRFCDYFRPTTDEEAYIAQGLKDGSMIRESDIAYADAYVDKQKSIYIKRIYISGPISGHDLEERREAFNEVESMLECQGYIVVNPMKNGLPAEATTHEHMKRDIELLMTCDLIYMMRHWTHSKGCKVEFDVATAIGLPVLFEESGELIEFE